MRIKNIAGCIGYRHVCSFIFLVLLVFATGAVAQQAQQTVQEQQTIHVNIKSQPLDRAITQLANQTGVLIGADANLVADKQAQALNGNYTPEQALMLLLRNSGLTAVQRSPGQYTLVASANTSRNTDTVKLPEVRVTGFTSPDAPGNPSYTRTNASTATKSNLPIMQTPISVQVIPRAVIKDQQAVQVEDAIKNVSGVFPGFTFGGFAEEFMIRGFNTNFANYRDGFRVQAARLSLANIERVEVVKGAAANLYGRIEPGGMINLITKRPQAERYYSLNQQFGSFGQYQTLADATGALNQSGTLMYRLNFEYLNKNSFRDFGFFERYFVAPSLTWKVTPNTQFDLDFMYSNEKSREDYGIVALGNRPADVPRSRFLGEPSQDVATHKLYNTALTFTHAFNDDWRVRARFSHFFRDGDDSQTYPIDLDNVTGILQRGFFRGRGPNNLYQGTVDVTGRFNTASIVHNVLAGWEYYGNFAKFKSIVTSADPINIFNPQYSPVNQGNLQINDFTVLNTNWNGVYFQDQITLFNKLHIMGGGRYDWVTQNNGFASGVDQSLDTAQAAATKVSDARFSPRAGIVYQPFEWLSFYGNYVQSLGAANAARDAAGNTLKPQIGEQFEGGFKTSLFDGRLNTNVAYYYLTKQNLATQVPGQFFSIPIGKARSQGVEVDVSGEIARGLSLVLTYAYTDTEILEGDNKGNKLFNVPKHSGSIWTRYTMQNEALRGLSFGAGVFVLDKRPGDTANTYFLPSQARVDAMVRYQLPVAKSRFSVQFNAYNLADQTLYGGTIGDRFSVNVGMPRTFVGSIHYAM
ncbi:MAG: TonB-dependent receptor [Nitrosomonas sp.]|nr:TonB-dependent receptor [Nitrosomonas sp.]